MTSLPPARFACIAEYGVPRGQISSVERRIKSLNQRIDVETGVAGVPRSLMLGTFGPSDLLVMHLVSDIRYLAIVETIAPVNHQRAVGTVVSAPSNGSSRLRPESMLVLDETRPFHIVANLKLSPLAKLLTSNEVVPGVLAQTDHILNSREWTADRGAALPVAPQVCLMRGLDTAEWLAVARGPRIDQLTELVAALQGITLADITDRALLRRPLEDLALQLAKEVVPKDVRVEHRTIGEVAELRDLAAVADVRSTVGMPLDFLTEDQPRNKRWCSDSAGERLTFVTRVAAESDGGELHDRDLTGCAKAPMTLVGSHGPVVFWPTDASSGCTVEQIRRRLGDLLGARASLKNPGAKDAEQGRAANNTMVAVDVRETESRAADAEVRRRFAAALYKARTSWLVDGALVSGVYRQLRDCARARGWAYSRTNSALNMLLAVVTLMSRSVQFENYIDLLHVLVPWLQEVVGRDDPRSEKDLERILKHIDRMLRLRQGKDRIDRSPRLSRSTEARAGYIVPRDAFLVFLRELMKERQPDQAGAAGEFEPLLVDGADPVLQVKLALGTGLFYVSAQRLVEPILWPTVGHEVEHVRLRYLRRSASGSAPLDRACAALSVWWRHDDFQTTTDLLRRLPLLADVLRPDVQQLVADIEEVLCDIALFDGNIVGHRGQSHEVRVHRFLVTMTPNLVMDLHDRFHQLCKTACLPYDERSIEARKELDQLAFRTGGRIAAVLGLAKFGPPLGPTTISAERLRAEIFDASRTKLWRSALEAVLIGVLQETSQTTTDAKIVGDVIDLAQNRIEDAVWEDDSERGKPGWAELLCVAHELRSADRSDLVREEEADASCLEDHPAIDRVSAFLGRMQEELTKARGPGALPRVNPRGGLTQHEALAELQQDLVGELLLELNDLATPSRLSQLVRFIRGLTLASILREAPLGPARPPHTNPLLSDPQTEGTALLGLRPCSDVGDEGAREAGAC